MRDLIINIKKEWMELVRSKKIIGLCAVALFFAISDPVMLKLTPYILQEFSGIDLAGAIQLTHIAELNSFHQDMYQMFTIVFVVIISNSWINEVKNLTVIIPVSKGVGISTILLAKIITYSLLLITLMVVSYSVNYYYAGMIFGVGVDYYQVLISGLLMGLFYSFCVVFIISISTIVSNYPGVIFITLLMVFGGPFLMSLLKIQSYTPFGLLEEAAYFARIINEKVLITIISTLLVSTVMYTIGTIIADKKEVIKYR